MSPPDVEAVKSGPLPYLLSVPPAGEPDRLRPLLCFLHGYDEGPPTPLESGLTRHGPLAAASSPLATTEFIVLAPQLPARGDLWGRQANAVGELVEQVRRRHGADPARTYLTGFSYGGNGVFDLGLEHPELWAALWPVDPTRVPEADPGRPVWLSSGQVSRGAGRTFTRRLGLEAVRGTEPGDRVYVDPGEDHVGTARLAYGDDLVYRWLLSKSLARS